LDSPTLLKQFQAVVSSSKGLQAASDKLQKLLNENDGEAAEVRYAGIVLALC
jgi:hypothetical protein